MLRLICTESDYEVPLKQWKFPCGEVGVSIQADDLHQIQGREVGVILTWEGNDDLFALAQLVDILTHNGCILDALLLPYFPYSRQDRRVNFGEAHALKVAGAFINSLKFQSVATFDPHSYVLEGVVDNLTYKPQDLCAYHLPVHEVLIAPDAGAAKKIYQHPQVVHGMANVITAGKSRGPTGEILSTTCSDAHLIFNKTACVVDDICDGGATFIELGKLLRQSEPKELNLYVTHGFFTRGLDQLKAIYDTIFVYNLARLEFRGKVKEI